ncbi:MAG: family 10 glycosylhydrolase [Bacteroidota bacterium]
MYRVAIGLIIFIAYLLPRPVQGQSYTSYSFSPKYEFRGVWITTVYGSIWPKSKYPREQRLELINIYQTVRLNNLNAVVFQVRARGDVMYPSQFEPFASSVTGVLGGKPDYDPLKFAIEEAHKFGLEFHAWWNVCKVADGENPPPLTSPAHIAHTHPEWLKRWRNKNGNGNGSVEWWLDIGYPQVRARLIDIAMELVEKYDIDAINFDYLRYPGPEFDDYSSYAVYGGSLSRDEWRRLNVTSFLREFYKRATAVKPLLKIGAAPIGIYKNLPEASGWQSYSLLYQDTRQWLREGIVDYIIPQLYWELYSNPRFSVLLRDWQDNSWGRHVYAGIGAFRPGIPQQIPAMIDSVRVIGAGGECYFTYNDVKDVAVFRNRYSKPALIPPMRWKYTLPPGTPKNLRVKEVSAGMFTLEWDPPSSATEEYAPQRYAIYRSISPTIDISTSECFVAVTSGLQTAFTDIIDRPTALKYFYVVTAFDKANIESQPSNITTAEFQEAVVMRQYFEPKTMLAQNIPNPMDRKTYIAYQLAQPSQVSLQLFDENGNYIETVVNEMQDAGSFVVPLYRLKLVKGSYRYTLKTEKETISKYMTVR